MIWVTFTILLAGALFAALVLVSRWRRRRLRLRLRLISGKGHLLGEEIAARCHDLERFDVDRLESLRATADAGVNGLHVFLLDRQAHLQNYEDLLHLQRHKLAIQSRAASEIPSANDELPGGTTEEQPAPPPPPPRATTLVEHREQIEEGLLDKIKEIQSRDPEDPPNRRRRRP